VLTGIVTMQFITYFKAFIDAKRFPQLSLKSRNSFLTSEKPNPNFEQRSCTSCSPNSGDNSFCHLFVSNTVVDVDTVCLFNAHLDKFWMHQDVLYDFTADLTGIGDRSVRESS